MRDGRFRRLNRDPSGRTLPWLIFCVSILPFGYMILFGGVGYLLNHGHPAALDRGIFGGLLLGVIQGLLISWRFGRGVAAVHLVVGAMALWAWIAWNPIYRIYVVRDPHDIRLQLIDQKP